MDSALEDSNAVLPCVAQIVLQVELHILLMMPPKVSNSKSVTSKKSSTYSKLYRLIKNKSELFRDSESGSVFESLSMNRQKKK
jgi:REP element-mobilizing transposase RayT